MKEKILNILQKIDWILFIEELTSQEKEEFTILKSSLKSVSDSLEFITGDTNLNLTFPESYVTEKTLNFLHEHGLKIDSSEINGDVFIWFEEEDDSNDYDYDNDDWSYDYWDFWKHGGDECFDDYDACAEDLLN